MRILVIGSGAREHALAFKLSQHHEVVCAPGNPGIAQDVEVVAIPANQSKALVEFAVSHAIDLAVVGPEDPLIEGLADDLRVAGVKAFGPTQAAAALEGSKAFSKSLMTEAGVPTASYKTCSTPEEAYDHARAIYGAGSALAVKVSGAALGRGVTVCDTLAAALRAIHASMVEKVFGSAGETLVLEELLIGREFSLLTLVGAKNFVSLPIAQDYKRAFDGDMGPNTGGMGSFSPCEWTSKELVERVESQMVTPVLDCLAKRGTPFTGLLFTGVMVTDSGPKCLEYNVRFGDPETESIMMRLEGDFGKTLMEVASGDHIQPLSISDEAAVTVIVASSGYPGDYLKGVPITRGELPEHAKLFYAGVAEKDGILVNSGGRVIAASATGASVEEARVAAYQAAAAVQFEGAYFRRDIASS